MATKRDDIIRVLEPDLLTEREVAERLRMPQATLRAWRMRGRLPAGTWLRLGERIIRYRRAELDAWIAAAGR